MTHNINTNSHTMHTTPRRVVMSLVCAFATLFTVPTMAQVVIGGNVYGGGNEGNVGGSASVELKGGTIEGDVYGGARMADVGGYTSVNINGAEAGSSIIARSVYGGNDISGTIGTVESTGATLPPAATALGITGAWNSFVYASTNTTYPVVIGTLYGGGNGDYSDVDYSTTSKPELDNTCIILNGGVYGHVYGGGNMATVRKNAVIYLNNSTALNTFNRISVANAAFLGLLEDVDYSVVGDNMVFGYHIGRMFGGNNKADMSIRPTWNLLSGSINNLYSGGNRGNMTYSNGIILPLTSANISVNNVYGGCRMADVNPGAKPITERFQGYDFLAGYAARVYITAGTINNVYGGNDISGKVYYGTNVAIFSDINGNVYGGGNGSYAYTDKETWIDTHPEDADYYYDPQSNSALSLLNFRPHIENTLIHIAGTPGKPVTIANSVYCGGNSATLYEVSGNATATFKIGKNVTIGNVFLGSNGENMITDEILQKYDNNEFSSLELNNDGKDDFATYMQGVEVNILPEIDWEEGLDNTTRIGSLFCGGNIGSMNYAGVAKTVHENMMIFPAGITITEKIVAGCNNANIEAGAYNIEYKGGLIGAPEAGTGDKVRIKVLSRLEPTLSTNAISYQDADGVVTSNKIYQGANVYGGCYNSGKVNGNVVIDIESDIIAPDLNSTYIQASGDYINASTLSIYGGGYGKDAVIDGNTTINLTGSARILKVFGGGEKGTVTKNTTVNLGLPEKVLNIIDGKLNAYKVYAGGYAGPVMGNTTLKLREGSVMSAFAGACNASIGGYTQAIVGAVDNYAKGLPYVTHAVYGGNDFGGTIDGSHLYNISTPDSTSTKDVRSQTYVQYWSGKIGRAIYGGSYGSYDYTMSIGGQPLYQLAGHVQPQINTTLVDDEADIVTNTFVDIASQSPSEVDFIGVDNTESTAIAGGGRGYKGLPDYVHVGHTYVLLHSTSRAKRDNNVLMSHCVYGGGNLSKVDETIIDAYSGNFERIFGGTHGVKTTADGDLNASYDCVKTKINFYSGMDKGDMDIFGAGANSGATDRAIINLIGGKVNEVHGGAFTEGYTANTEINVLNGSTIQARAIYGGGYGEDEARPCDVGTSNIRYASTDARVIEGIYGGNHNARATMQTNVTISVPVKNPEEDFQSVYGAGYGAATVAGFTHVILQSGAQVANVYGGGREGKVYNHYSYFNDASAFTQYNSNGKHATWTTTSGTPNTLIEILHEGANKARVEQNVYGAGLGATALTSGLSKIILAGGVVVGDIYGGGYAGTMLKMDNTTKGHIDAQLGAQNIGTLCEITGGEVRKVFGGGYQGRIDGNTEVTIGTRNATSFYNGRPAILRNVYGGSERAVVDGDATVNMYDGYIGYEYLRTNDFTPVLDLDADISVREYEEEGNIYGAGYGEGAVVTDNTYVNLYDGRVRNSLYGGGEIAAVGVGTITLNANNLPILNSITKAGKTHVKMYGGKVEGDVFGGGRGYTYTYIYTGENTPYTNTRLHTDGYVFGSTDVEIYRGIIGTDESVAKGHGNVFGGGNIGYVYSPGEKYTGATDIAAKKINGHYYKDDTFAERTEDCRVHITAYCQALNEVTIDGTTYAAGKYVPTEKLNTLLASDNAIWEKLDDMGITIRNAVFAGGNVASGTDIVYANAVTVYGNATAAVVDVFSRDLISLGGEHVGGLYGDGNLTFVDGYRELNITNYGTDYYRLTKEITPAVYDNLTVREKAYYTKEGDKWIINSTSGRTMNTIQRADFCGVFGSRFLLHGAQDRVPDVVDYTNYTINRVGEVSLNTQEQPGTTDKHGNYFGIYNVVNLLGALTSDIDFTDTRQATMYIAGGKPTSESYTEGATYWDFKMNNLNKGFRNNATSLNKVALASGVYLELIKSIDIDPISGNEVKNYGPITGVIELDLINVKTGEGGGYVYAINQHGTPNEISEEEKKHLTLSTANSDAITQSAYTYTGNSCPMQSSGNFVHYDKRVVDDCFPNSGDSSSPVHFWYISGNYFVYEQFISAYTGAARSYAQTLNIPLTITDGSNGQMSLVSVNTSKYATQAVDVGNYNYEKNTPISHWDYTNLPTTPIDYKTYFVDNIYTANSNVWANYNNGGSTEPRTYHEGDELLAEEYDNLLDVYLDEGMTIAGDKSTAFAPLNEMSHDNGYMLTFEMSNPKLWDNQTPTIECNISGIYGQSSYELDNLVGQTIIAEHSAIANSSNSAVSTAYEAIKSQQAIFEDAYIAISSTTVDDKIINPGNYISKSKYDALDATGKSAFERAYICIKMIEVADKDFILPGDLISKTRYDELHAATSTSDAYLMGKYMTDYFSVASVCTKAGKYGGKYFEQGLDYPVLDICVLPKNDRNTAFTFNQDAFDLFSTDFNENIDLYGSPYNETLYVDFNANYVYNGSTPITIYKMVYEGDTYNGKVESETISTNTTYERETYQKLLNEQAHYAPVKTLTSGINYIVYKQFDVGETKYRVGQTVTSDVYNGLTADQKDNFILYDNTLLSLASGYICIEGYKSANITNIGEVGTSSVTTGTVITNDAFAALPNSQKHFAVVGLAAIETATLYVPRESSIENLSKDRIVTVILEYRYKERNPDYSFEERVEKHVVNIHIEFKSGQPTIGDITPPSTVFPSSTVGLSVPTIIPGAYEIIGGGWEIFENQSDAYSYKNGVPYLNNATPMYWYQDGYYVAYYAKTYLGKVYSNPVPFSIANYHRVGEVMNHPEYMHIDHAGAKRAPKLYIDEAEYESTSLAYGKGEKNDMDYWADLYMTSLDGEKLNARVKGCANLEFILRSDFNLTKPWQSIGKDGNCFAGTLHGNGHTINGLTNSLFGNLCGKVYNLGVTGEFTGGGIADYGFASDAQCALHTHHGLAENCWVRTSATPTGKAIIGEGGTIVNSYYHAENAFVNGAAIKMDASAFEKGEVTYLLNSFYQQQGKNTYYLLNTSDNSLSLTTNTSPEPNGYVENYYVDGDFVYANGEITLDNNERYDDTTESYYPIYPDDYIFFGQRLTYDSATHNHLPTRIDKTIDGNKRERIVRNEESDRVYRAPAYFMSGTKDKIYFNRAAKFFDSYELDSHNKVNIHHNLTAIDFTGAEYLDYEEIQSIAFNGLTRNILVYADESKPATYAVLESYLREDDIVINDAQYKTVAPKTVNLVRGHLVTKSGDSYIANYDHFLVDKENFNVPISYKFADDKCIWYQRQPDRYAHRDHKGWDIVCLPFTATLVTTNQKGEITHFYGNDTKMHEYWLRELKDVTTTTQSGGTVVTNATFERPVTGDSIYIATNKFLYDTYYKDNNDNNLDQYQQSYYAQDERIYTNYAYLTENTPYIIAFPGVEYYEFDMSGNFTPQNISISIPKLGQQVVTMVSENGATIGVTDTGDRTKTNNGYTIKGVFQKDELSSGYLIDNEGYSFNAISGTEVTVPFRGYIVKELGGSPAPKRIFISGADENVEEAEDVTEQGLTIYGIKGAICIESTLDYDTIVDIFLPNGLLVNSVAVQAMSKEVVPVSKGIYIIKNCKVMVY